MGVRFDFDNTYSGLPETFYARLNPTPVTAPRLVALNRPLAEELGLDPEALLGPDGTAVLAGNQVPEGADPLAQAYAGHQFGGFVPQLGDGRAILLGEVVDRNGIRRDIQLKGSGRTPFSRMGDGRAWLGPVIREYLVSEAMAALGVPTTRALAVVTTGEPVIREAPLPGAVLTRVARSHIRVGTFQYFSVRRDTAALEALTDYVIGRHYPSAESPLDLLAAVVDTQAELVASWMGLGFIHGVMNTDNTTVSGETIDYGPCAFMDAYHPNRVFSSIDHLGRYAYANQPNVLAWNLAQFATTLLPIMGPNMETNIERATEVVNRFGPAFQTAWLRIFRAKIGLNAPADGDIDLVQALLETMAEHALDFTETFRGLSRPEALDPVLDDWREAWLKRLAAEDATPDSRAEALSSANPWIIPRNHQIETAITKSISGDYDHFFRLHAALATPYSETPGAEDLTGPPAPDEVVTQTFCGT